MVKWLTALTAVIAVLWSGWWFVGVRAVEQGAEIALASARAQGWEIVYDDLAITGFPSRFDTTLTEPRINTPDGSVAWTAPFFQVFALAYRPNHVIAVAPNEMAFEIPGDVIDVTNADLRGSVVVSTSTAPVLERSTIAADSLRIAVADLWVEIGTGQFATRQAGSASAHDVAVTLSDLGLAPSIRALLDASAQLPERIDTLAVEAEVGLTAPVGAGGTTAEVETILLRRAELLWGETGANLTGEMSVGPTGLINGTLTLALRNWGPLVQGAVAQGLLTPGEAAIVNAGIGGLVNSNGVARVPVTLTDGQLSILGLPVAVLPSL